MGRMCNLIFMMNTWFTRFIFWLVRYISSLALFCREIFALFLNFLLFFLRVCEWCRENKKLNFFFLTLLRTACNLNEISWHLRNTPPRACNVSKPQNFSRGIQSSNVKESLYYTILNSIIHLYRFCLLSGI